MQCVKISIKGEHAKSLIPRIEIKNIRNEKHLQNLGKWCTKFYHSKSHKEPIGVPLRLA